MRLKLLLSILGIVTILTLMTPAVNANCTEGLMNMFNDDDKSVLLTAIMSTGKGINDLGDYDACNQKSELKHATLKITDGAMINLYIGACIPAACTKEETDAFMEAMTSFVADEGMRVELNIGDETTPEVTTGNILGFVGFGILACMMCFGMIIQYTPLFDKSNAS